MKHMKKFAGLLLALIMVMAMATTAFAAENVTISAPEGSTRTYEVYQIFTGDLSGKVLSNVKWGKNGTGTEGEAVPQETLDALAAVNSLTDTKKLEKIKEYVNLDSEKYGTVSNGASLNAPTGYYLIKEVGTVGAGEAYSLYVVQVVGPTTISPKVITVTSEKKVDDKNDSNNTQDEVKWEDSADYDIADDVPFQLKATISGDYDKYTTFQLTFHDKEAEGLKFNNDVVVKVDGVQIESGYEVKQNPDDGHTFDVHFADLKQIKAVQANSVITVEYTSKLTTAAKIGSEGNKNTMHVTYSNNPNQTGENGKTPEDTVIVFTYKLVVNKVTKNPAYVQGGSEPEFISLKGAGFTLHKKNASGDYVKVGEELKGDEMVTFEWTGLDDGDYKIIETTTPAGYNTAAPIEFTITAEHEVLATDPKLTSLSGGSLGDGVVLEGSVSTDVVNLAGAELPSTGGMGTTIFYALGTILVLGAAVLLVTKKRVAE